MATLSIKVVKNTPTNVVNLAQLCLRLEHTKDSELQLLGQDWYMRTTVTSRALPVTCYQHNI